MPPDDPSSVMRAPDGELASLAHDLRSALSATAAYVDLARERLAGGQLASDDLDHIDRGLERMNRVLERLQGLAEARP
jgi:phosphoglycerate-specific signal transduction histidine kinase